MIIGITGGTGCGKTTALNAIRELGGIVIDCDREYHWLLKTDPALLQAIDRRFPGVISGGKLDRKKLGSLVFSSKEDLEALNRITQKAVTEKVLSILEQHSGELAAIDAIRLFETGLDRLCHITVAVTAPENVRIQRLMQRDGIDASYAALRIAAQKPQKEYEALCDYVLCNDRSIEEFHHKCLAFFRNPDIIKEEKP